MRCLGLNRITNSFLRHIYGALLRYCFGQKTSMTDKVYLILLPFASLALLVSKPQKNVRGEFCNACIYAAKKFLSTVLDFVSVVACRPE